MEMKLELKQAVEKYRAGDKNAFNELYEHSKNYVYVCINKVLNGTDNQYHASCEVLNDTYLEISLNIDKLQNVDKFLSWAGTIATRKSIDYLRKNGHHILFQDEEVLGNIVDSDDIIPEAIVQDREKQKLIRQIIDNDLTPIQRACIISYFYNDLKQSEIAKELGIPENTVKTNLSIAKGKIKDSLIDLDKNQGTRLYSAAPVFAFIFMDEIVNAIVPHEVSKYVLDYFAWNMSQLGNSVNATTAGRDIISSNAGGEGARAVGEQSMDAYSGGHMGADGLRETGEAGREIAESMAHAGAEGMREAGKTGLVNAAASAGGKIGALTLKAKVGIALASIAAIGATVGTINVLTNDDNDVDKDESYEEVFENDLDEVTSGATTEMSIEVTEDEVIVTTEMTSEESVDEKLTANELRGVELMVKYITATQGTDYASAIDSEVMFSNSNILYALGAMTNDLYDEDDRQLMLPPHYYDEDKYANVYLKSDVEAYAYNTLGASITTYSGMDGYGMYEDGDSIVYPAVQSSHREVITITDYTIEDEVYVITGTKAFLQSDPMDLLAEPSYSDEATIIFKAKAVKCDASPFGLTILSIYFDDSISEEDATEEDSEIGLEGTTEAGYAEGVIPPEYVYDEKTSPAYYYHTYIGEWDSETYYDIFYGDNENISTPYNVFHNSGNCVIRQGEVNVVYNEERGCNDVYTLSSYIMFKRATKEYSYDENSLIVTTVNDGYYPMLKVEPIKEGAGYVVFEVDDIMYCYTMCIREIDGQLVILKDITEMSDAPHAALYEKWSNVN